MRPTLSKVTWSLVQYSGGPAFRGYYAALIFQGAGFERGITWAYSRPEADQPPVPQHWGSSGREKIQTHNYFEVSTNNDPEESPLSWRGYKFAVKNPNGEMSDWVEFSYDFDLPALKESQKKSEAAGRELLKSGQAQAAIEPLRRAMTYADRLFGVDDPRTVDVRRAWNKALDEASLAKIKYKVGDSVEFIAGPHDGLKGVVTEITLRHAFPYTVALENGGLAYAAVEHVRHVDER